MARILRAQAAAIIFIFLAACSAAEASNSDNNLGNPGPPMSSTSHSNEETLGQPDAVTYLSKRGSHQSNRIAKRDQQHTSNSVTEKQEISVVEYLFREDLNSRIDNITDAEDDIAAQLGPGADAFIHGCFTEKVWRAYKAVCADIRRIDWRPVSLEDSKIISCDLTTPTAIALCNRLRAVTKNISDILKDGQQLPVTVGQLMRLLFKEKDGGLQLTDDKDIQFKPIDGQAKVSAEGLANLVNPAKAELDALMNDTMRLRSNARTRYSESRKKLEDAWIELAENCTAFVRQALFYAKIIRSNGPLPSINCPLAKEAMLADISELTREKGAAQTAYQIHQEALGQWIETAELFERIGELVADIDLVAQVSESLLESLSQPTFSEPTAILCALLRLKAGLKQLVSYANRAKVDHGPDNSAAAFSAPVEAFRGFNVTLEDYECAA